MTTKTSEACSRLSGLCAAGSGILLFFSEKAAEKLAKYVCFGFWLWLGSGSCGVGYRHLADAQAATRVQAGHHLGGCRIGSNLGECVGGGDLGCLAQGCLVERAFGELGVFLFFVEYQWVALSQPATATTNG